MAVSLRYRQFQKILFLKLNKMINFKATNVSLKKLSLFNTKSNIHIRVCVYKECSTTAQLHLFLLLQ